MLWPETDLEAGRNRLNVVLSALRRLLEPPGVPDGSVLITDRFHAALKLAAVTTDVGEMEAALRAAAPAAGSERAGWLAEAVEAYRGPLLPGCYDEWAVAEQERLARQVLQALCELVDLRESLGDRQGALDYAHRAVALDPLHEESRRKLIRLYAATGQTAAALQHFRGVARRLRRELGADPAPATRLLAEQIQHGWVPDQAEPARDPDSPPAADPAPIPALPTPPGADPAHRGARHPARIGRPVRHRRMPGAPGAGRLAARGHFRLPLPPGGESPRSPRAGRCARDCRLAGVAGPRGAAGGRSRRSRAAAPRESRAALALRGTAGLDRLARGACQRCRSRRGPCARASALRRRGSPARGDRLCTPPSRRDEQQREVALARAGLGEERAEVAWSTGGALTLEAAVSLALERERGG
jgi:DNA-binding SARP family transcriptional activator